MYKHIPIHHAPSRERLKDPKEHDPPVTSTCLVPNYFVTIDWEGECYLCSCEAWLPVSVGKIESFDRLEDIWNNDIARGLQANIADKKFTWCDVDRCGIRNDNYVGTRYTVAINIDESCNLRCPSCRKDSIMITEGPLFDKKHQRAQHLVKLLEKFDQPCHVIMSGNGDVLASNIMRPIVHEFQPMPQQTFRIFTNGLLLKKQLKNSRLLSQTTEFQISIDAGSKEVYDRVRLGGKFEVLIENFDFLKSLESTYKFDVWLMYALQAANWRDLRNFADLCERYGWQGNINHLSDWKTWDDFSAQDVIGNKQHPEHNDAMSMLRSLAAERRPNITFDNIFNL